MSDNLLEPLLFTREARMIDLQRQEIALLEQLIASYKRDVVSYEKIIATQDDMNKHLQRMLNLSQAIVESFKTPAITLARFF